MVFNYNKLKGKIVEVFGTQAKFAVAMGWSERTLSLKLNGVRDWKQGDIYKAANLLGIEQSSIPIYFLRIKFKALNRGLLINIMGRDAPNAQKH